ncbi:MAG TPA: Gfo/Idh/MocA family oxidoreductase [Cellulomonas sp.]
MSHRLVVVGYGTMGVTHAEALGPIEGVEVAGVVDVDQDRLVYAVADGHHVYGDLDEALADPTVDVVFVCTPNEAHHPIALRALAAGKHVITEKPAMLDSAQLAEVIAAADAAGLVLAVHQNRRWDEDYLAMKQLYDTRAIGRVAHIETRVHGSRGIPGDWRALRERGGGMLLDWGVHLVDRLLVMVGSPVVNVYGRLSHVLGTEVDDGFRADLTFANGVEAVVDVSTTCFVPQPIWLLRSAEGTATVDDWELHGRVVHRTTVPEADAAPVRAGAGVTKTMAPRTVDYAAHLAEDPAIQVLPVPRVPTDVTDFYRNVLAAIDGTAELVVRHDEVLRTMRVLEAIARSHETNEVVHLETEETVA